MDCDRLKRLVKTWYSQVQEETMAPARMVTFMRQHIAECTICLGDLFVRQEVEKIIEVILPANKLRPAESDEPDDDEEDDSPRRTDDDEDEDETEDEEDDEDEDEDEDF